MGKCIKCREEMKDNELYATPMGWMCVVCLRIVARWAWRNDFTLRRLFLRFWPEE